MALDLRTTLAVIASLAVGAAAVACKARGRGEDDAGGGSGGAPARALGPRAVRTPETEPVFAAVTSVGLDASALRAFHDASTKVLEIAVDATKAVETRDRLEAPLSSAGWYPVVVRDEH